MFNSKRFTALLTAILSACTLAAAPAAHALDDTDVTEMSYEDILRAKGLDPDDMPEEQPEDYIDPEYAEICTRFGDVNYDKVLGIADAVQLQRYLLGDLEALGNWKNADLDGDGDIDAADFSLLKQQIAGLKRTGGTLAVSVVDMMTGEPVPGASVSIFAICDQYGYDLGSWTSTENHVVYFSGLPTDEKYRYIIDCGNLPEGYGNEYGNWDQQMNFSFEGKTDLAVNVRLIRQDAEPNVHVRLYDWAMDSADADTHYLTHGLIDLRNADGTQVYGMTPHADFALPDGDYHLNIKMHECPLQLLDPESDFAAHIKEIHPDAEFTDKRNGIDFSVKDGQPDKDLTFDLSPLPGKSNSITVNCTNQRTGEPLEGVKFELIEAPETYAKKIAEWTSDATGTHNFEGLLHSDYRAAYAVRVMSVPEGFAGGYEGVTAFGYVYDYNYTMNYAFFEDTLPKTVSARCYNFEDGSQINDIDTYEIWRIYSENPVDMNLVYNNVRLGEKVSLPDGTYEASLIGRNAAQQGLSFISLVEDSRGAKTAADFFDPDYYFTVTTNIKFNVVNGQPDKDLVFFLKNYDPSYGTEPLTAEELAKYEAIWGSTVTFPAE